MHIKICCTSNSTACSDFRQSGEGDCRLNMKAIVRCEIILSILFWFAGGMRAEAKNTVYQKLNEGSKVRIAVVGDSIACGAGVQEGYSWDELLKIWLEKEFGSSVILDNYAEGGTATMYGYYQCETRMKGKEEYDLIIICYGQNDFTEDFSLIYENLLRSLKGHSPSCDIITILESSQKKYTEKIEDIIRLSNYYGASIADTLQAFAEETDNIEGLHLDGIHPNRRGHEIYFETVYSVIKNNIISDKKTRPIPEPSVQGMEIFHNFRFIPLDECIYTDGGYQLVTSRPVLGILIQHTNQADPIISVKMSTGEVWSMFGKVEVGYEFESALLIDELTLPGTVVQLEDPFHRMSGTVEGFIVAG